MMSDSDTEQMRPDRGKQASGPKYWKSLEQLVGSPEIEKWAEDEFPYRKDLASIDRRDFLKVMGASLMFAGVGAAGCRTTPESRIVPYIIAPEDRPLGETVQYATSHTVGGYAIGLLATSYEGRPIRLDGNPLHPTSESGVDARTQAQILGMYDPDRLRSVQDRGEFSTWISFLKDAREKLAAGEANDGSRIAILTESVGSPSLASQIRAFQSKYPGAQWYQYDAVNRDSVRQGAVAAFGQHVETRYRFDRANVILAVDSNTFMEGPGAVRYMSDIMGGRQIDADHEGMNRIYVVEHAPSTLGVTADHRIPLKPSQMLQFVRALAAELGMSGAAGVSAPDGVSKEWIAALAADLMANGGASVVVPGDHLPPSVHAVVHGVNEFLGNVGRTVIHTEPVLPKPADSAAEIRNLVTAMESGLDMLLILGGNPVYDAPADLGFVEALKGVSLTAHLSLHADETGAACDWELPDSHFLESWSDGRAFDGTASIQQPLIEPLYDCKSAHELLDALAGESREGLEIVRSYWRSNWNADASDDEFDKLWRVALSKGVLAGTEASEIQVQVIEGLLSGIPKSMKSSELELVILPDPTVYDGRYANNGWLQELPKPISNLTWDNSIQMSHATALKHGVEIDKKYLFVPAVRDADVFKLTANGRSVEGAVYVNLGMADDVIVVHLGYGRTRGGRIIESDDRTKHGGGFSAYRVRDSRNMSMTTEGVKLQKTKETYPLANTQFHNTIDVTEVDSDREIFQEMTLERFRNLNSGVEELPEKHEAPSMYDNDRNLLSGIFPDVNADDDANYQWAMTIDLTLCTGCNACVMACVAENNIPVVNKYQVQRGREMHWIRIDRYYTGGSSDEWPIKNPQIKFQPVTCMHCEHAPCEPVCPVAATIHSKEGLNQMVYNRCVGTRYCSNNCPYKVRRFNFLNYANLHGIAVKDMRHNPSVTVRGRGVMEKCTYCVQRINETRITAKKERRKIGGDEVRTACQVACPTNAIVFGDKSNEASVVAKSRKDKRNYILLEMVNTRPRTTYLARVTNLNEEVGV
ncbi:MAG: TAT-variant-translocated molybdopterin oxidoreductase [Armatimonadetes bacterium]|nr:TAT-variant-translocated molybdopterin oxidoreductase [Armatimonadota bacterium]